VFSNYLGPQSVMGMVMNRVTEVWLLGACYPNAHCIEQLLSLGGVSFNCFHSVECSNNGEQCENFLWKRESGSQVDTLCTRQSFSGKSRVCLNFQRVNRFYRNKKNSFQYHVVHYFDSMAY